jgi:serine/threonine-protein kinase
MAPEQAQDTDGTRTTKAADIYAFACSAFELLTGRSVFEGEDIYEILLAHMNDTPPAISSLRPELAALDPAFARALSKAPEQRQRSCTAFLRELDDGLAEVLSPRSSLRPTSSRRLPAAGALRVFLLESDDALARQITRAADKVLDVPALECFSGAADLVSAFERAPAEIVILDEDSSLSPPATVINALRRLERGRTEIIVLTRTWSAGPSELAELSARELPKPINVHVLSSVLAAAGNRTRSSRPPAKP